MQLCGRSIPLPAGFLLIQVKVQGGRLENSQRMMTKFRSAGLKRRLPVVLALCLSFSANAALAQEAAWQADLRKQLLAEKSCELNYLTVSKTYELLGRTTVEARNHCTDKRAYDAIRSGTDKLFELKSCEVVTC